MSKKLIGRIVAGLLLAVALYFGSWVVHYESERTSFLASSQEHLAKAESACTAGGNHNDCALETSFVSSATESAAFVRSNRNSYGAIGLVALMAAFAAFYWSRRAARS